MACSQQQQQVEPAAQHSGSLGRRVRVRVCVQEEEQAVFALCVSSATTEQGVRDAVQ